MAVCKKCGCAIPLGSKSCDICATLSAIAPAQQPATWSRPQQPATSNSPEQPTTWNPPQTSVPPLSPSAPSWSTLPASASRTAAADSIKAQKSLRRAFWIFTIVGALNLGLGALAEFADLAELQGLFNWGSIAEGAVWLVLAYFTWRGSVIAAIIGTVLYVLDSAVLLYLGYFSPIRLVIIIGLVQAVLSAYQLRQRRRQPSAQLGVATPPDQTRAA